MEKLYIFKNTSSSEVLKKVLNENNIDDYEVIYNDNGKPYIKNNIYYFNISNKDDITVLLLSDYECGVDIEKIKYNEKIVNKYYNKKEQRLVNKAKKKEEAFTKIWVKKESYIKMLGIGLKYGIENVDTTKIKYKIKKYGDYYIGYCLNK